MFEPASIGVFVLASLLLAVSPGPAVLYIVSRGVSGGQRAGVVSALGIATGGLLHVTAAVLGISALVAASARAFTIIKWAGAAYLIYLGVRTWRSAGADVERWRAASTRRVFADAVVVNALNPKAAVFFLAFLPQFVDPARGSAVAQTLVLGAIFIVVAFVSDTIYGLGSGWVSERIAVNGRTLRRIGGVTMVGLGIGALAVGRSV